MDVFVMEADGKLLVHPSLVGQSLKGKAGPVFDEVAKGTAAGDYVRYEWGGAKKCTYSRKTKKRPHCRVWLQRIKTFRIN